MLALSLLTCWMLLLFLSRKFISAGVTKGVISILLLIFMKVMSNVKHSKYSGITWEFVPCRLTLDSAMAMLWFDQLTLWKSSLPFLLHRSDSREATEFFKCWYWTEVNFFIRSLKSCTCLPSAVTCLRKSLLSLNVLFSNHFSELHLSCGNIFLANKLVNFRFARVFIFVQTNRLWLKHGYVKADE